MRACGYQEKSKKFLLAGKYDLTIIRHLIGVFVIEDVYRAPEDADGKQMKFFQGFVDHLFHYLNDLEYEGKIP